MKILFNKGKNAPELAVCWYVGQMLCTEHFIDRFVAKYIKQSIHIEELRIEREEIIGNNRIDLCLYITDNQNRKYGIIIEAKVHWPNEEQLANSVKNFTTKNPNFEAVFGLHFISTIKHQETTPLSNWNGKFQLILIKDFLQLYFSSGIETGHSLRWASDLHQLLNYEQS